MTEPNKELPKEVEKQLLDDTIHKIGGHYQGGYKGMAFDNMLSSKTCGAKIAQSHYAPIIEDLKQKYDQSDKEADHWESKYIMSDAKVQAQAEQLSEKDKRIAELEAEVKKVMGLLKDEYLNRKGVSIIMRCQHTKKLLTEVENEFWADYCKENGIDLGGE